MYGLFYPLHISNDVVGCTDRTEAVSTEFLTILAYRCFSIAYVNK